MVKLVNVLLSSKKGMFLLVLYILSLPLRGSMFIEHAWSGYITVSRVMGFITVVEVVISEPALYR